MASIDYPLRIDFLHATITMAIIIAIIMNNSY